MARDHVCLLPSLLTTVSIIKAVLKTELNVDREKGVDLEYFSLNTVYTLFLPMEHRKSWRNLPLGLSVLVVRLDCTRPTLK